MERKTVLGALGVCLLVAVLLLVAIFASPPYAFYGAMKWAVGIGGCYVAWVLYESSKAFAPLCLIVVVTAGIHFFAKMHREQWVVFNWAGVLVFALSSIVVARYLRNPTVRFEIHE